MRDTATQDQFFCEKWSSEPFRARGVKRKIPLPFRHKYFLLSRFLLSLKKRGHLMILDFGCGTGHLTVNLELDFEFSTVGIDISRTGIEMAKKNAKNWNAHCAFIVCDILLYPEWYSRYMFISVTALALWLVFINKLLLKFQQTSPLLLHLFRTIIFYFELFTIGKFIETAGVFFMLIKKYIRAFLSRNGCDEVLRFDGGIRLH